MESKRTGNNHSDLLASIFKKAEVAKAATNKKPEFADRVKTVLASKQDQKSLKEVLAGLAEERAARINSRSRIVANGLRKTAQFEDPALTSPAAPPGGADGFDAGLEAPLGDEGVDGLPGDPGAEGAADPEVKDKIRDAFIALCGGVEEAKAALEEAAAPEDGLGGELGSEVPGDELSGDPLDGGMSPEVEEPDMPAPMPMPGDTMM